MGWQMLFIGGVSGQGSQSPTIWQSDGTKNGTHPISTSEGIFSSSQSPLGIPGPILFYFNGKIYAQSPHPSPPNLLVWDTHQTVHAGIPEAAPLHEWTEKVFNFTAADGVPGTAATNNQSSYLNPQGFTAYKDLVYFNGTYWEKDGPIAGGELFSTDGTPQGTTLIPAGPQTGLNPSSLTVAFQGEISPGMPGPGQLFFAGSPGNSNDADPTGPPVLFAYDGSGQPAPAPGIDPNNPPFLYNPAYLTFVPGPLPKAPASLFMSGQISTDSTAPQWLWRYDGMNSPTNIDPTRSGLAPYNLVQFIVTTPFKINGVEAQLADIVLFFSGVNNDGKRGLWISLGTKETTWEIPTPKPSSGDNSTSVYPFNLTPFGPGLYFTAYDTYINGFPSGRGLFAYDPVNNQVTEPIHSNKVQFDPGSDIPASGGLSQTTLTLFPPSSDLYFSGSKGVNIGYANLWQANLGVPGQQGVAGDQPAPPPTPVYSDAKVDLNPMSLTYQWM